MLGTLRYGIDAPRVVYSLLLCAGVSIALFIFGLSISNRFVTWYFFLTALSCSIPGLWMLYSSLVGKKRICKQLIARLHVRSDARVLDVGCGSGLFLIEMAKHLKTGKAIGIDLWFEKDQSTNSKAKTLQNGLAAKVSDRIEVETADMRKLPFSASTFDLVVSSLAIHNVKKPEEREQALREIIRVLKPGGKIAILDFQNTRSYADFLEQNGLSQVEISSPYVSYFPFLRSVTGVKK